MKYNHTIKDVKEMNAKYVDLYIYNGDKPVTELTDDEIEWVAPEGLAKLPDSLQCEYAEFDKEAYYRAGFWRALKDGETALVVVIPHVLTYDVFFDNDTSSNNEGWKLSYDECMDYIRAYNGTDVSYFEDYKGGVVSITCNETEETVYSEKIR